MDEEFVPEMNTGRKAIRELFDWVEAAMIAVVCVVLLFTFIARMAGVDGDSMYPTLEHQDRLIITRINFTPQQGDIVVVTQPNARQEPLIKRVIATQGQELYIDFDAKEVYVDGEILDEPYISEPTYLQYDLDFPQVIPEGCVFVMGDNRNNSWDSRNSGLGMVDERYLLGKVIYRILPYNKLGVPR